MNASIITQIFENHIRDREKCGDHPGSDPDWTAMAFRGWTGMGMQSRKPVRVCMTPNMTSTLVASRFAVRLMPTINGRSVPISPNAPANSLRSKRMDGRFNGIPEF